ncbi:MAG: hypothetical protein K2X77_15030 [Candidatus Obscuribacterales bacterium]|jgi:hypothetical protein|nr:hypothetical protein [Candidatus Obscuribacterales bacterium]
MTSNTKSEWTFAKGTYAAITFEFVENLGKNQILLSSELLLVALIVILLLD